MLKWGPSLVVLCTLLSGKRVGAECALSSMSIETTEGGLAISGCYRESVFRGIQETTVWTIEGEDVEDTGTTAIMANLLNGPAADPVWTIGTVVSLPANTWSDGTQAGLEVINMLCVGTSIFWETRDPTEESQWKCDNNGDGELTLAEAGDFDVVACGCGDEVVETTPSPATSSVGRSTSSPVVPVVQPSPAPGVIDGENPDTAATPAPDSGEGIAPEALACNLTISSAIMQDVAGCYVGQSGSNARGYWVQFEGSSWIEWVASNSDQGYWAIMATNVSDGAIETRCTSDEDVVDPVEITTGGWRCDIDGDRDFDENTNGDFTGLECSEECTTSTSLRQVSDGSSDSDSGSPTAIIAGSVLGGMVFAGLVIVALVFVKKKNSKENAEGAPAPSAPPASSGSPVIEEGAAAPVDAAPVDPNAKPSPIPMFEPWGSRPPPRNY